MNRGDQNHGCEISPRDLELFRYVDGPAEALALLQEGLSEELERTTPAFAKSVRPCCEPGQPGARHATTDCHEPPRAEGRER